MTTLRHLNPDGLHRNPAFSQAVVASGVHHTIYIGGQNAVDAQGALVGRGDLAAQTRQAFRNLEVVLAAAGAELQDIVKWNVHLVAGQPLGAALAVFQAAWAGRGDPPAVTVALVAGLANPDFLIELDAIAVVPA